MIDYPLIRVLVDWNDDSFVSKGVSSTDTPNLIPNPISLHTLDITPTSDATYTREGVQSDYGVSAWRFYSEAVANQGLAFGRDASNVINDIPVSISTQYTLSAWVRGVEDYATTDFSIQVVDQTNTQIAVTSSLDVPSDGSWLRVNLTFTTDGSDTHIAIILRQDTSLETTIELTGLMLVTGNTIQAFNVGADTDLYDDITSYVEGLQYNIGKSSGAEYIPSEGTLNLTLNNYSRIFSPENSLSPLHPHLQTINHRILFDVYDDNNSVWVRRWSGWTANLKINTGLTDYQAILDCEQGIFRLTDTPLRYNITGDDLTTDEVIDRIITGGWLSAANPYAIVLDKSRIEIDTWVTDLSDFRTSETGVSTYTYAGEEWKALETPVSTAISDLLQVEQGTFWIDANGIMQFRNRDYGTSGPPDITLDLDTEANSSDYVWGNSITNLIKVSFYPKNIETDGVLWTSRETIVVPKKSTKEITAKFEYPEGGKLTSSDVNAIGSLAPASTFTAVSNGGVNLARLIDISIDAKNGEATVKIRNKSTYSANITLVLRGTSVISYGSSAVEREQPESVSTYGARRGSAIDNKLISDETTAIDLGDFILARYALPIGTFKSFTIKSRNPDWLELMLSIAQGTILELSENQSAVADKRVLVIGEAGNWTPGLLTIVYNVYPTTIPPYWLLDVSVLGEDTYLAY